MSQKIRGFEIAKGFEDKGINLPKRSTSGAAGYDFEAAEDIIIPSMFDIEDMFKPVLVPTGVKAYMLKDERLELFNRSSNPIKNKTVLSNGVGLIDSDYYSNPDNDGHIMFQFVNYGPNNLYIEKGDRIGQGVFSKYLLTDDDSANGVRVGGHGSTGV